MSETSEAMRILSNSLKYKNNWEWVVDKLKEILDKGVIKICNDNGQIMYLKVPLITTREKIRQIMKIPGVYYIQFNASEALQLRNDLSS